MIVTTTLFIEMEIPEGVEIPNELKRGFCEQITEDMINTIKENVCAKGKLIVKGKSRLINGKVLGDIKVEKIIEELKDDNCQCCECIHFKSGAPTWGDPIPMNYCSLKNNAKYGNEEICKNFEKTT